MNWKCVSYEEIVNNFAKNNVMLRIATLLRNFRNPTNTSIHAYLQANLLHVGV